MPAAIAPMRKVREVLRLRHALGRVRTQIAITVSISRSTVGEYLWRAAVIGIPVRCRKGWTTASSNAGCSRRWRSRRSRHGRCPTGLQRTDSAPGAKAARRDAAPAVGGISRRTCRLCEGFGAAGQCPGMIRYRRPAVLCPAGDAFASRISPSRFALTR
jgi:hypothetical protein